jgi:hypothetical protein
MTLHRSAMQSHLQTLPMQSWPAGQSAFDVHCGFASLALQHTFPGPQTGMRASMCAHWSFELHE